MMVLAFAKFKNIFYILTKQLISSLHQDKRTSLKISVGFLKIFLLVLCAGRSNLFKQHIPHFIPALSCFYKLRICRNSTLIN